MIRLAAPLVSCEILGLNFPLLCLTQPIPTPLMYKPKPVRISYPSNSN